MKPCPNCNKENAETANYCDRCGTKLNSTTSTTDFDKRMNHFEQELHQFGKKIEDAIEQATGNIDTWYDKVFGAFGPIIISVIGMVFLLFFLKIFGYYGSNYPWLLQIADFLEPLLIIFVCVQRSCLPAGAERQRSTCRRKACC